MTKEYTTSEDHVPADTSGEVTIQVTDEQTKEIFETRARIAPTAAELDDPAPLTITRGPHESTEDEWYIEIIETDVGEPEIDEDLLRECLRESREESNVITARSEDVKALVSYLVETGEYDSLSVAIRSMLREHLSETHPGLVEEYVDLRAEFERDELAVRLRGDDAERDAGTDADRGSGRGRSGREPRPGGRSEE